MKRTNALVILAIAVMLLFSSCDEISDIITDIKYDFFGGSAPTSKQSGGGVNSAFNGTWVNEEEQTTMVLNNGSFAMLYENFEWIKGTYSTSGNNMILANKQVSGDFLLEVEPLYSTIGFSASQWYTEQQFRPLMIKYYIDEFGCSQAEAEEDYEYNLKEWGIFETDSYTLNGNSLTGTLFGESVTLTKQGTTQAQNTPSNQTIVDVDIDSLKANAVRAEQNYGGKTVRTRGRIYDIDNHDGEMSIFLVTSDNGIFVRFIESERSKIAKLDSGQTISVIGVFVDGEIRRAVLVE